MAKFDNQYPQRDVYGDATCYRRGCSLFVEEHKYIEETGSVKRGIQMLIECHQNHLAFTEFIHMDEVPFSHPIEVQLVGAL